MIKILQNACFFLQLKAQAFRWEAWMCSVTSFASCSDISNTCHAIFRLRSWTLCILVYLAAYVPKNKDLQKMRRCERKPTVSKIFLTQLISTGFPCCILDAHSCLCGEGAIVRMTNFASRRTTKNVGSVIKTKSKLDHGLGNLWTSKSLLRWVILRGQMLF